MIPITEHTIRAIAALVYNMAYEQDPDTGWLAHDEQSGPEPPNKAEWLEWSRCLLHVLGKQPAFSDEYIIEQARLLVDTSKVGTFWNTIFMEQTEDGDRYSFITDETNLVMKAVRDFLENPYKYVECRFLEDDPEYLAYLEAPIEGGGQER